MTNTEYIVQTASECMPSTCRFGEYRRVAVLEVDPQVLEAHGYDEPRMISERARGVVRVVKTWDRLNVGTTERCAYRRALVEARELADELNDS